MLLMADRFHLMSSCGSCDQPLLATHAERLQRSSHAPDARPIIFGGRKITGLKIEEIARIHRTRLLLSLTVMADQFDQSGRTGSLIDHRYVRHDRRFRRTELYHR